MKKIASLALSFVLALVFAAPALAADNTFIRDEYGILTPDQAQSLEEQASQVSQSNSIGVYLLFTDDLDGKDRTDFARDYYMNKQLGLGEDASGILLVVAIDSRDYITVANERGTDVYMPYCSYLEDEMVVPLLSQDLFASAGQAYVSTCASIAAGEVSDANREEDYRDRYVVEQPKTLEDWLFFALIGLVAGAVIAAIACFVFFKQMKTAQLATLANDYVDASSFRLSVKEDQFLHSTISKVPRPKDNDHGSGGSGGFSSSGGGKF